MKRPKGFALKILACREILARCERDLGREVVDHMADLFCDQDAVNSVEQAMRIRAIIFAERGRPVTKMRYPGGDPENGPAYLQKFDGHSGCWSCAEHDYRLYEEDEIDDDGEPTGETWPVIACRHCGDVKEGTH